MDEEARNQMREWAHSFESEDEFLDNLPEIFQGIIDLLIEAADEKQFLTQAFFRQVVMFFMYSTCMMSRDALHLGREDFIRLAEVSYDSFVALTESVPTSDRKDN